MIGDYLQPGMVGGSRMIRPLSAPGTFVQKYVLVALCFCVFGVVNALLGFGWLLGPDGGLPSLGARVAFLAIWLAVPLAALWLSPRLMRVRMSVNGLLISDVRQEIFVPFSEIESISPQAKDDKFQPIDIRFRTPTVFGDRIRFVPRARYGFLPWIDPAVSELRERVKRS
jgi:hypothetical protein